MEVSHDWEMMWAPYDEASYEQVVDAVGPDDVVLDIGAGDLRLAMRLARRAAKVYAVEMNARILPDPLPSLPNLHVIQGDARLLPFPDDVQIAVLLMRHCRHFYLYLDKLMRGNCSVLFTNARWGMGVENVAVQAVRRPFRNVSMGWYACRCGSTGFIPGPPEMLTPAAAAEIHEVRDCPHCAEQMDLQKKVYH